MNKHYLLRRNLSGFSLLCIFFLALSLTLLGQTKEEIKEQKKQEKIARYKEKIEQANTKIDEIMKSINSADSLMRVGDQMALEGYTELEDARKAEKSTYKTYNKAFKNNRKTPLCPPRC